MTPTERCAHALLACVFDQALGPESPTAEPGAGHGGDPVSDHERETRRLVALLAAHLCVPVAQRVTDPRADRVADPAPAILTRREIEVLDAVADGLSTAEIAAVLHISPNTARNHVQRILEKLEVHSRLQAVNAGVRHGLLQRRAG